MISRRSVVGASLATGVLGMAGVGVEALAKQGNVTADGQLGIGARCNPPKIKHGKKHGCNKCRTDFSVAYTNAKGQTVRKCACKPVGQPATSNQAFQCCSGVSDGNQCISPTGGAGQCVGVGTGCTTDAQCCNGICNVGGSTTGPLAGSANTCVVCKAGRATCSPVPQNPCCVDQNQNMARLCLDAPGPTGTVCTSITGEQCDPDPAATSTAPRQGTCQRDSDRCTVAGNIGLQGVCCTASGRRTPGLSPTQQVCPSTAAGCCTGQCNAAIDACCAPTGQNPTLSGGTACTSATPTQNFSCCSGFCTGTTAETSLCVAP